MHVIFINICGCVLQKKLCRNLWNYAERVCLGCCVYVGGVKHCAVAPLHACLLKLQTYVLKGGIITTSHVVQDIRNSLRVDSAFCACEPTQASWGSEVKY